MIVIHDHHKPIISKEQFKQVQECIDRLNALKAVTINCAYAMKQEDRMGSIKKGKLANFAVLDKDLLNDPKDEILKAKIINTIVDGNVVYKGQ